MLRPGERVGDRYIVSELLAAGGMGKLWRARHLELDVDVAIKMISVEAPTEELFVRFKREARAIARLRSPNVVHILDFGVHDERPYYVMELLDGEDLAGHLHRRRKLDAAQAAWVLDGIAKALQLAHDAGIVHRDIKPANVFLHRVGDDVVVKVLDFGVAKIADNTPVNLVKTTGNGVIGSPAYMSPEQVSGTEVDSRSDAWSLAAVLFEMVTGVSPFAGDTLVKTFDNILREPIPVPSAFEPSLRGAVDAFFVRAFARDPEARFASVRELAAAFPHVPQSRPDVVVAVNSKVDPAAETKSSSQIPPAEIATARAGNAQRRDPRMIAGAIAIVAAAAVIAGAALSVWQLTSNTNVPTTRDEAREPTQPESNAGAPGLMASGNAATSASLVSAPPSSSSTVAPPSASASGKAASERTTPRAAPRSGKPPRQKIDPTFGIPLPH